MPTEGNGNLQTLIRVLVARPRRCPTLSNPVPWQNWMAAYLGYTLQMKTLFRGWPVMVHDTHTRRKRSSNKWHHAQQTLYLTACVKSLPKKLFNIIWASGRNFCQTFNPWGTAHLHWKFHDEALKCCTDYLWTFPLFHIQTEVLSFTRSLPSINSPLNNQQLLKSATTQQSCYQKQTATFYNSQCVVIYSINVVKITYWKHT